MTTTAVPFRITQDMHANNGQRFVHYIVDLIIIYLLTTILLVAILLLTGDAYVEPNGEPSIGITYLILFIVMILYYSIMETLFSKTIGKFITKTKVITQNGEKPDNGTIIQRSFCRLIPFDALSFLGSPGKGWHDSISRTFVVKSNVYDAALELHNSFEEIGTNAGQ